MDGSGGSFVAVRRIGIDSHSSTDDVTNGSAAWIGRGFSCVCAQRKYTDARPSFCLSPSQEESLLKIQSRIEVVYDGNNIEHQETFHEKLHWIETRGRKQFTCLNRDSEETLRALWYAAFPGVELRSLISEQWKDMGWQGKDPSTDFRGGGFLSLENLVFFAKTFPKSFQHLLQKQEGDRSPWEYPFAVAGVNITFMLIQMLDLESVKPRTITGAVFLMLLSANERAFDLLYCISFKLMDRQWLAMHASYMDFNAVMKTTRRRLERELLLDDIERIEDMPSYGLLLS